MKPVSAISALCAVAIIVPAVLGQDKPRERDVSVTGRGSILVQPDEVSFKVGVDSDGASLEAVRRDNDSKMAAVMKALRDSGVPEKDMVTTDTSLRKRFTAAQDSRTRKDSTTYNFSRIVAVRLRNLAIAADVLANAVKAGANSVTNFAFVDSKKAEHTEAAMKLAVQDALRTADQLAQGFGAKRGKVLTISQKGTEPDRVIVTGSMAPMQEGQETVAAFAVGDIQIEVAVNATFELQ